MNDTATECSLPEKCEVNELQSRWRGGGGVGLSWCAPGKLSPGWDRLLDLRQPPPGLH